MKAFKADEWSLKWFLCVGKTTRDTCLEEVSELFKLWLSSAQLSLQFYTLLMMEKLNKKPWASMTKDAWLFWNESGLRIHVSQVRDSVYCGFHRRVSSHGSLWFTGIMSLMTMVKQNEPLFMRDTLIDYFHLSHWVHPRIDWGIRLLKIHSAQVLPGIWMLPK